MIGRATGSRRLPGGMVMEGADLRRYVARETAIGIIINVLVVGVPGLLSLDGPAAPALRPVREVAVSSTPQFFMAALMSALVPSLLFCRRRARARLRPDRAALVAAGLAAAFTLLALAAVHVVVAPLARHGMDAGAILALRIAQAALAAATLTPLAILLLVGSERPAR